MSEHKGYIRPGEALFVSIRYPQLSLVVDGGGAQVVNGRTIYVAPKFVNFHPGPFGGELRVNAALAKRLKVDLSDLLVSIRERDRAQDEFEEVKSDKDLSELARRRDVHVEDKGERVVRKIKEVAEPEPEAPPVKAPAVSRAAAGPKKGKVKQPEPEATAPVEA